MKATFFLLYHDLKKILSFFYYFIIENCWLNYEAECGHSVGQQLR